MFFLILSLFTINSITNFSQVPKMPRNFRNTFLDRSHERVAFCNKESRIWSIQRKKSPNLFCQNRAMIFNLLHLSVKYLILWSHLFSVDLIRPIPKAWHIWHISWERIGDTSRSVAIKIKAQSQGEKSHTNKLWAVVRINCLSVERVEGY